MSTDAPITPSEPETPANRRERQRRERTGGDGAESPRRADRRAMLRPGDGPMVILDDVTKAYSTDAVGLDGVSLSI
jgi:cell division transport system ATP-binding protein